MNIKRNIVFTLQSRTVKGKVETDNLSIRMRVNYGGQRIDFSTGYRIGSDKWDLSRQRVKNRCTNKQQQNAQDINGHLDNMSSDMQAVFKEFEVLEILPTPTQLKDTFDKKQNKECNSLQADKLLPLFSEFMQESSSINNWSKGTIKRFATLKNHLTSFDKDMTFQSLIENRLNEFTSYFLVTKSLRNCTVEKFIKDFKWFLRWATKKGYNKNMAFQDYKPKLKIIPKKVIFLNWDELNQLKDFELPKSKNYLEKVRDVFLFQCFTGLRHSDVYNLKWSDIKDTYFEITTIKTMDSLKIDLNTYSRAILDKYKDCQFKEGKLLPVISNQKMNDYLKELGEIVGLDEPIRETYYKGSQRVEEETPKYNLLSSHAGRRSFICISLSLGIPAHTVMKWTGHKDYKAMKPYIDVSDTDRKKAMTSWDKKEETDVEKLIEQLKKIPKEQLKTIFAGLTA